MATEILIKSVVKLDFKSGFESVKILKFRKWHVNSEKIKTVP